MHRKLTFRNGNRNRLITSRGWIVANGYSSIRHRCRWIRRCWRRRRSWSYRLTCTQLISMRLMCWPRRHWNFNRLWIVWISWRNVTNGNFLFWCWWIRRCWWRRRSWCYRLTCTQLISMRLMCRPRRHWNLDCLRIIWISWRNMTNGNFLFRCRRLKLSTCTKLIAMG